MTSRSDRLAASAQSVRQAPAPLDLVQDLLNTCSLLRGFDRLSDLEQARAWLSSSGPAAAAGLAPRDLTEADLGPLRALRDALREARSTIGAQDELGDPPWPALDAVAANAPVVVSLDVDGTPVLRPHPHASRVLATVLAAVVGAADTWPRLKICANPGCRWAFYDTSRNHSGTWCDMSICGTRAKMARYRRSSRRTTPPS